MQTLKTDFRIHCTLVVNSFLSNKVWRNKTIFYSFNLEKFKIYTSLVFLSSDFELFCCRCYLMNDNGEVVLSFVDKLDLQPIYESYPFLFNVLQKRKLFQSKTFSKLQETCTDKTNGTVSIRDVPNTLFYPILDIPGYQISPGTGFWILLDNRFYRIQDNTG